MKKYKFLGVLMAFALSLAVIPGVASMAHADWEDGDYCWNCGHYHWNGDGGDHMDDCGACSIDCDEDCYLATHCNNCGTCFTDAQIFCEECLYCEDCMQGSHCPDCGDCYLSEEEGNLCGDCWRCESCAGELCDDCGFCEDCIIADNLHCESCDACYSQVEQCADGGNHCEDCCIICEQCDECKGDEYEAEMCDECGLCLECCLENAQAAGCSCDEYCVESSNWDDHFCQDCGECFDEVEQCEFCGLCVECSESYSDCTDSMCVEDPGYEEHFCIDCGECFHEVDLCTTCEGVAELRCEDCCKTAVQLSGCDCDDDWCISDSDFDNHLAEAHAGVEAEHRASAVWSYDTTGHWHNCILDDDRFDEADHNFNEANICKTCGYSEDAGTNELSPIKIKNQPKSAIAWVSVDAFEQDSLYQGNNLVDFSIRANGPGELNYQWQIYKESDGVMGWKNLSDGVAEDGWTVSGATTPDLTISVSVQACHNAPEGNLRCVVSSSIAGVDEVTSREVTVRAKHLFTYTGEVTGTEYTDFTVNYKPGYETLMVGGQKYYRYKSTSHELACLGDECVKGKNVAHRYSELGAEYNQYSNWTLLPGTDEKGKSWKYRDCLDCGYTEYAQVSKANTKLEVFFVPVTTDPEALEVGKNLGDYTVSTTVGGIESISATWYENGVEVTDPANTEIKEGATYRALINATTKDGYVFPLNPEGSMFDQQLDDISVTNKSTQFAGWSEAVEMPSSTDPSTDPGTDDPMIIDSVDLLNVVEPVVGASPNWDYTLPSDAQYGPNGAWSPFSEDDTLWFVSDVPYDGSIDFFDANEGKYYESGALHTSDDTLVFEEGKYYTFLAYVSAKDGYDFKEGEDISVTVNGKTGMFLGYYGFVDEHASGILVGCTYGPLSADDSETPIAYVLTKGNGQTITQGDAANFVSNAPFGKFSKVIVDGVEVAASNYAAQSGSTDITFTGEYTGTLSVGNHSISVVSTDGQADGAFTVKAKSVDPGADSGTDSGSNQGTDSGNNSGSSTGTNSGTDSSNGQASGNATTSTTLMAQTGDAIPVIPVVVVFLIALVFVGVFGVRKIINKR